MFGVTDVHTYYTAVTNNVLHWTSKRKEKENKE